MGVPIDTQGFDFHIVFQTFHVVYQTFDPFMKRYGPWIGRSAPVLPRVQHAVPDALPKPHSSNQHGRANAGTSLRSGDRVRRLKLMYQR